jgi:hypothetical protein
MMFEVDFTTNRHKVIHTAFIFAETVSDCKKQAGDILKSLSQKGRIQMFIGELILPHVSE